MNKTDFMEEYNAIFERSLLFSIVARQMGLMVFEKQIDEKKYNQRDIFEYGMRLITEGKIPELIDKIFTNLIDQEPDKERKILMNMQKEAVFAIQRGDPSQDLMRLLNSYADIDLEHATKKYKEIEEYITNIHIRDEDPEVTKRAMEKYKYWSENLVSDFYKGKK